FFYQIAAFHAGTATPADQDHPAKTGEALETYGTGLGATVPPIPAGLPAPSNPPATVRTAPTVTIDRVEAKVTFAGLTPGLGGVYQINIIVPTGLGSGQHAVTIKSGENTVVSAGVLTTQ